MKKVEVLRSLFWDYDFESVKKKLHSYFVIARVLELGTYEQFEVLKALLSDKKIIEFLKSKKGKKLLSRKSLNFWLIYYEIKKET